jgi:hypothetical protein
MGPVGGPPAVLLTALVAVGLSIGWYRCHAGHVAEEAKVARRLAGVEAELAATQDDLEVTAGRLTQCSAWMDAQLLAAQAAGTPGTSPTPPPRQVQAVPGPVATSVAADDAPGAAHEAPRADAHQRRRHRVLQVHGMEPPDPDTGEQSDR